MRKSIALAALSMATVSGCTVYSEPPPPRRVVVVEPAPPPPDVVVEGPVVEAPGVEVISVEPPPEERVYVYEVGYPPGVYFCGGYYWYGGYRYPHDVFVHRYVEVNIREHRYINVEENRRRGMAIERTQRVSYQQRPGRVARPAARRPQPRQHASVQHENQRPY